MIKVYTGPMYAGKSTHLLLDYTIIKNKELIKCFKPSKDIRDFNEIKARNCDIKAKSIVIKKFEEILKHIKEDTKYIFIDEAQFIEGNYNILTELSLKRITIIIAGLSKTSELKPFGCMPNILAIADEINLLKTYCNDCGNDANYTWYNGKKNKDILVGDKEYEPLCLECYKKRKEEQNK